MTTDEQGLGVRLVSTRKDLSNANILRVVTQQNYQPHVARKHNEMVGSKSLQTRTQWRYLLRTI